VRGALHGTAACVSLAVALHLAALPADTAEGRNAFLVLALSQCALYLVSALYHSAPWVPLWKRRMQRLDHAMIYIKVAGTLTPFLWIGAAPQWRGPLLALTWAIAALGAADKLVVRRGAGAPVRWQLAQACLVLPVLPAVGRLPGEAPLLLGGAAALYAAGAAIYVTRRPSLWPGVFSFHELFHLLLVIASACIYAFLLGEYFV
jgi:hemolysin III